MAKMTNFIEGIINTYNAEKGFGYIKSEMYQRATFFHISALTDRTKIPTAGRKVRFSAIDDAAKGTGRTKAISVEIIEDASDSAQNTGASSDYSAIFHNRQLRPASLLTEWASITLQDNKSPDGSRVYVSCLKSLKNIALTEKWDFSSDEETGSLHILDNYLRYTFFKLTRQNKIAYSGDYATFNTGLVDSLYEPIYALFKRRVSTGKNRRPFLFSDFCVAANGDAGKTLIGVFEKLPDAATYFTGISDVVFESNLKIFPQYEHIIDDAIIRGRYPAEFLQEKKPNSFVWNDERLRDDKEKFLRDYRDALRSDDQKYRGFKNRIDDAISLARKKARWNFKTAIPLYFPKQDSTSLILPIALLDDSVVDMALVTAKINPTTYYASTVLPLDLAYINARLVCRPDSDWLTTEIRTESHAESSAKGSVKIRQLDDE